MHPFLKNAWGWSAVMFPFPTPQPPHTGMFTKTKERELKIGVGMMYKVAGAWNKSLIFMGVWAKICLGYRFGVKTK